MIQEGINRLFSQAMTAAAGAKALSTQKKQLAEQEQTKAAVAKQAEATEARERREEARAIEKHATEQEEAKLRMETTKAEEARKEESQEMARAAAAREVEKAAQETAEHKQRMAYARSEEERRIAAANREDAKYAEAERIIREKQRADSSPTVITGGKGNQPVLRLPPATLAMLRMADKGISQVTQKSNYQKLIQDLQAGDQARNIPTNIYKGGKE